MRILIGSPSADGDVEVSFANSVLSLVGSLLRRRPDWQFDIGLPVGRDVGLARDLLANQVLADQGISYLLFIDTDMGFRPDIIEAMFELNEPVVGTIAPQRVRNLDLWREEILRLPLPAAAEICASSYTPAIADIDLEGMDDSDPRVAKGFLKARQTGAGILLIRRDVFETMRLYCPDLAETRVRPAATAVGLDAPLIRFFSHRRGPEGVLLGEDLSFTSRWVQRCGGEIWVYGDALITHAGSRVVTGDFRRKMQLTGSIPS
jgi:hypothetical protein